MTRTITRRRFLRDSTVVSGGAALLAGLDRSSAWAAPGDPMASRRSDGVSSQVEYGDADDDFIVRWTHAGGTYVLELTPDVVRLDVPTRGAEEITLADFEHGQGEHDVVHFFGEATLEQLRNDIALLQLVGSL